MSEFAGFFFFFFFFLAYKKRKLHLECFTWEATSTIAVYGKHIFQNNFSLTIMLEMLLLFKPNLFAEGKCGKNLSHHHQVFFKIWDLLTCKCYIFWWTQIPLLSIKIYNIQLKNNVLFIKNKSKLESLWKLALNE